MAAVTSRANQRCYWPCFSSMFIFAAWSYNALYYRGLKSNVCIPNRFWSAIADNIIGISQVPRSLEEKHRLIYYLTNFHLRCWFLRPANCLQRQFRVAQISSTGRHVTKLQLRFIALQYLDQKSSKFSPKPRVRKSLFQRYFIAISRFRNIFEQRPLFDHKHGCIWLLDLSKQYEPGITITMQTSG